MPAARPLPLLLANEQVAAELLSMSREEFRKLVKDGALPPPVCFDRWRVADLERIVNGDDAEGVGAW